MFIHNNIRNDAIAGIVQSIPLVFAATPFAIVYGALGESLGMSFWLIIAISMLVFAGASQFIALTLLAAGTPIGIIIFTVFLVNIRHMLYAISLVPQFKQVSSWVRIPMAYTLTDETFAIVTNKMQQQPNTHFVAFYLGSALFMYCNWALWSGIGFYVGSEFSGLKELGLEIAMVVAFAGIVVSQLKNLSHYACLLVAGIAAVISIDWPHQSGLLFSAFAGIATGLVVEYQQGNDQPDKKGEHHA